MAVKKSKKIVQIDEGTFFDQFQSIRVFYREKECDETFQNRILSQKWIKFFKRTSDTNCSELLKICNVRDSSVQREL